MSEGVEIRLLRECPEHLGTIARWVSEEWEETTAEALGERVLENVGCPPTLVAVSGGEVVGVIAFTLYGTDGKKLGGLWVNVLYVGEAMRGKGIGKRLVAEGVERARGIGAERLFVCTDVGAYYEALGWERNAGDDTGGGGGESEVLRLEL